jgi:MFS family permease
MFFQPNRHDVDSLDQLSATDRRAALRIVTWAWVFGAFWFTTIGGAPMTRFALALGAEELHFGLLAAMPFVASLLSLPASVMIQASGQRKGIFLLFMLAQRFFWVPIALLPPLLLDASSTRDSAVLWTFLGLMLAMFACGAVGGPAWVSWMADVVPSRIRGRYFGRRRQWGILSAIPSALLAGFMLDHFTRPDDPQRTLWVCSAIFLIAGVAGVVDIALFWWVPHARPVHSQKRSMLSSLTMPLHDRQFMLFCGFVGMLMFAMAPMGQFVTLYLDQHLKVNAMMIQLMLLVVPLVAQLVIVPIWGRMADRFGRRPLMAISSLGLVPVGLGWCLMNSGAIWLGFVLSAAGAMLWAAVEIANLDLILDLSGSSGTDGIVRGPAYTAVNAVVLNISACIGGIGAGLLMDATRDIRFDVGIESLGTFGNFELLFLISALVRLLAVSVFLPLTREPTPHSTFDVIRITTGNIYSNFQTGVLSGLRGRR